MEKIEKIKTKKEVVEYVAVCEKCEKKIIGSTEKQVRFNLGVHKQGKECREAEDVCCLAYHPKYNPDCGCEK